jgi:hypothetical protein
VSFKRPLLSIWSATVAAVKVASQKLIICCGFTSINSAFTVQRDYGTFRTVFGREPPSEMSITESLVKLAAFVKERIPGDIWSLWWNLLKKEPRETAGRRSSDGRSSRGLRSHWTQDQRGALPKNYAQFRGHVWNLEVKRYQLLQRNCPRQISFQVICCSFQVLKVANFLRLKFSWAMKRHYIYRGMLIDIN